MNIISLIGLVLTAAVISVSLKKHIPEYSVIINIVTGAIVVISVLSEMSPAMGKIKNLITYAHIPHEYGAILLKSLGICFAVQFASDSCKDAGENSMASKIEFAGKIGILITALPLFETIIQTSLKFMGVQV